MEIDFFSLKMFLFLLSQLNYDCLQIKKINLRYEETLQIPGLKAAYLNDTDQILVRTEVDDKFYIRVMNRLSGEVSSEFPSKCDHFFASLIAHPTDEGFVLEGCFNCQVIRNYNIHNAHCNIVYEGYLFHKMCRGPTGSILWFDYSVHQSPHVGISIVKWDKEHQKLYLEGRLILMCYNEFFGMLVGRFKDNEIKAVKFESEGDTLKLSDPIWKLPREVDGLVIKPGAFTSDKKGNVYIGDGANNRILMINSLTGTVQSIFHLEEGNREWIGDLFWSDTEPNLIVRRGERISSYCFPGSLPIKFTVYVGRIHLYDPDDLSSEEDIDGIKK